MWADLGRIKTEVNGAYPEDSLIQNLRFFAEKSVLPLRMPAHVFSHLLDHSLLHLLPPPALNVPAGRAPREASEGGAGKKAADGDERAAEHGPASARNSGHREGGACGQGRTAIE